MSRVSGAGRRGKRERRWTMSERGTCWPVMLIPLQWPSLTSDSMWNVEKRFYIGRAAWVQTIFLLSFFLSFISTFLSYSSAMKCSWRVKCGGKDSESSSSRYCSSSQTGRKPWSYAGSRGSLMLRPWQTAGKLKRFLFDVRNINFVGILNRRKHLLFVR